MNEHSHLKNLINLGFIIDEKLNARIENLTEEEFYRLIENLKKENVFVVNEGVFKNILSEDVKILRAFTKVQRFNVQDYVRNLNERYSFLQNILIKKLELPNMVSIDKASDGSASIIGIVKEKEEKIENIIISLEDSTGEMKAVITKKLGEKLALDDVIALTGNIKDKILNADRILFPDVPFKPVAYTQDTIKVAFLPEKNTNADYIVFNNKVENNVKNKEINITNPCILKINNVLFLVIAGSDPLEVLKKRYVNIDNTDFIIEPSPDIVFTDKDVNTNYKGISIVSRNKIIDLKTREVQNI
jgi:DNA polymerase II small subunit/DNA polymerase delta subunit B